MVDAVVQTRAVGEGVVVVDLLHHHHEAFAGHFTAAMDARERARFLGEIVFCEAVGLPSCNLKR
eukprot:4728736-Prorocentrum_lima.AAC.1